MEDRHVKGWDPACLGWHLLASDTARWGSSSCLKRGPVKFFFGTRVDLWMKGQTTSFEPLFVWFNHVSSMLTGYQFKYSTTITLPKTPACCVDPQENTRFYTNTHVDKSRGCHNDFLNLIVTVDVPNQNPPEYSWLFGMAHRNTWGKSMEIRHVLVLCMSSCWDENHKIWTSQDLAEQA